MTVETGFDATRSFSLVQNDITQLFSGGDMGGGSRQEREEVPSMA